MIGGALTLVAWLCLGHAVAGALYLALINVPDANVGMLAGSLALALGAGFTLGVTDVTAVNWLRSDRVVPRAVRAGLARGLPAALLALVAYGLAWLSVRQLHAWYAAHTGEIDAWWIATFDSSRTTLLHRAITAFFFVLRDIVGVSAGLALLCGVGLHGVRAFFSTRWLHATFSRMQLGAVALGVILFIVVPWRFASWRPAALPATWIEPAFVGLKLALLYLLAHVGWALMLLAGTQAATAPSPRLQHDAEGART